MVFIQLPKGGHSIMFCYQCEQTAKGTGCTTQGVCGKSPEAAALQDLLVHGLKGLARYSNKARKLGAKDHEIDVFVLEALFSTVTNVDFDPERLQSLNVKLDSMTEKAKKIYVDACIKAGKTPDVIDRPESCKLASTIEGMVKQGEAISIEKRKSKLGDDITGLQELLTYGLKGTAAYADHAHILGKEGDSVYAFFHEALDFLNNKTPTVDELVAMVLKCGEVNLKAMEILDAGNTGTYGHPEPTLVRVEPVKGKAILVSGHDLRDLELLLKQTEGKGINIYTHSEMLPAHAYPGLKKYKHLAANYGGAWQDQRNEFDAFPGAILMTTNCIQRPKDSYKDRIFTTGLVAWQGVKHIDDKKDFTPVIEAALKASGFTSDGPGKKIMVGFGRNAVLSVAGKVVEAVKAGAVKHFFLIGGCDGAKPGRNYYTDFAKAVPNDCVILTLACGKFRFNKHDFGSIDGIPRLLDVGQCNDAYSAIQIAVALANAFNTDVNSLPLSLILSWFEQKAVCILLTLLHLGIKNIRIGPSLPAFVSPNVLKVLVDNFNIIPISDPQKDLKAILG
jgi:hydroxylamine reductase